MMTSVFTAYAWKLALVGMAIWRRKLDEQNWPYNAVQREVRTHVVPAVHRQRNAH